MRLNRFALFVLVLVTAVSLVSCAGPAAPAQSTAPSSDQVQACLSQTSTSTVAEVDALILARLQNHHAVDRIYTAQHTREEWNVTLDRMNSRGAGISDAEKQVIIDYLLCRQQ